MAVKVPSSFRKKILSAGEGWIGEIPFVATLADGREVYMRARVRTDRHIPSARYARHVIARVSGKMPKPTTWIEVSLDREHPYPAEIASRSDEANSQARKWLHLLAEFQRPNSRGDRIVEQQINVLDTVPAPLIAMLGKDICPQVGKRLTFYVFTQHYLNLTPHERIYYGDAPRVTIASPVRTLALLPR